MMVEIENGRSRPPFRNSLEITVGECVSCIGFAVLASAKYNGGGSDWKGGLIGPMSIMGHTLEGYQSPHFVGKLGEFAVAKIMNVPVDFAVNGGDDGKDLMLSSGSVQVKTSQKHNGNCLVNTEKIGTSDFFVFCTLNQKKKPRIFVDILGWCTKKEVLSCDIKRSPRKSCRHFNYEVWESLLRPISSLVQLHKKGFLNASNS